MFDHHKGASQLIYYRVLSPQFELIHSQSLCILQLLDILHLLSVASQLLRDQDLHTPAHQKEILTHKVGVHL